MSIVAKRLDASGYHALGTEVGLGAGQIVLDGDPAPPRKGAQQPTRHFWSHFALARPPISATAELLLRICEWWG